MGIIQSSSYDSNNQEVGQWSKRTFLCGSPWHIYTSEDP